MDKNNLILIFAKKDKNIIDSFKKKYGNIYLTFNVMLN